MKRDNWYDLTIGNILKATVTHGSFLGGIKPIAESTMSKRLKESLKAAELSQDIHLHSLRISCASLLYNNGAQPLVVQKILGHKDLKTTMEIYTQVYSGKMAEAVTFLDNITVHK